MEWISGYRSWYEMRVRFANVGQALDLPLRYAEHDLLAIIDAFRL